MRASLKKLTTLWRSRKTVNALLITTSVLLALFSGRNVVQPVSTGIQIVSPFASATVTEANEPDQGFGAFQSKRKPSVGRLRPNLFKPTTRLRRQTGDATVERILSMLKFRCVMMIQGEPTAFVKVKDQGTRKCQTGDTVSDLFTVLDVNPEQNNMTIEIAGKKRILGQ